MILAAPGRGGFKRTPGSFKRAPGSFKRTPGSFKRTPNRCKQDDDVLVVLNGMAAAHTFCDAFKRLATPHWTVSLDELSDYGVPMLDLFIFQGPRFLANGLLDYYPHVKATRLEGCSVGREFGSSGGGAP